MDEQQPFRGRQAVRSGTLTTHQLRTRYRALHRDVYVRDDLVLTAAVRAKAAWLWANGECVLCGPSAAAVLGTRWLDDDRPAELVRADRHSPPNIVVHAYDLAPEEVCVVGGLRVTTPARTAFDIGRHQPWHRAVPTIDALMAATGLKQADVVGLAGAHPGLRGVRWLRGIAALCDGGAESPQESRVRLMFVRAGLPAPETQIEFRDEYGHAFIRVDMGWREWKVAVEYDGIQHWSDGRQRAWDIERIALLEAMGWVVIRVSAHMLSRPHVVIERVRTKLRAAGCPV